MPNPHLPDVAQVGVGGHVEDIQRVAGKRSPAVQVTVAAAALTAVQANPNVSGGA